MKKDKKTFTKTEHGIKSLMEGHSFEVDTSALWDAIEPQLDPVQEDKRRPIRWLFAGGLGMAIIGLLAWNILGSSPTQQIPTSVVNQIIETTTTQDIQQPTDKAKKTSPTTEDINNTARSNQNQSIVNSATTAQSSTSILENSHSVETLNQINSNPTVISIQGPTETPSTRSSQTLENTNLLNVTAITPPQTVIAKASAPVQSDMSLTDKSLTTKKDRSIQTIDYLALIGSKVFSSKTSLAPQPLMIEPIRKQTTAPFFALQLGATLPQFAISATGSEGLDRTQFDRETPLLGAMSTLRYGRSYDNGWEWTAGLRWTRLISRYRNTTEVIETSTTQGNEAFRIDEDGNITAISGEVSTTIINNYDVLWHKNNDYLDLQIGISRNLWSAGSWSIGAGLNATYNVYAQHSGYYFEQDQSTITKFSSGDASPYRKQGLGLSPNLSIMYDLGDFSIGLSPSFTTQLSNTTNNSNYYQIKNSYYGMQVCTRYRPQ